MYNNLQRLPDVVVFCVYYCPILKQTIQPSNHFNKQKCFGANCVCTTITSRSNGPRYRGTGGRGGYHLCITSYTLFPITTPRSSLTSIRPIQSRLIGLSKPDRRSVYPFHNPSRPLSIRCGRAPAFPLRGSARADRTPASLCSLGAPQDNRRVPTAPACLRLRLAPPL